MSNSSIISYLHLVLPSQCRHYLVRGGLSLVPPPLVEVPMIRTSLRSRDTSPSNQAAPMLNMSP